MTGYLSEIFVSFQGEGPFAGRKHVFVRLAGCNLRCVYCDTPDSLERTRECRVELPDGSEVRLANPLGPERVREILADVIGRSAGLHAIAVTGGEPLLQAEFLRSVLEPTLGVPVLLETNGTYPDRLESVLSVIDIVSMDVKLPSNSGEAEFWKAHGVFLERCRDKAVYVKIPVDEGTKRSEFDHGIRLVAACDARIPVYIQPIFDERSSIQVSPVRLREFYDAAVERVERVHVLPQAHRFLGIP